MPYNRAVPQDGQWIGDLAPEEDAPKDGRWIARPQKARSFVQIGVFAGFIGQLPNLLHVALKPFFGEAGAWIGTLVFFLSILILIGGYALRERRARRMRPEDFALVDGAFGDQYPVEVTIVAGGSRLGSDRGVVWFADGLMGFSGRAASFVLAPRDAQVCRTARPKTASRPALPANAIELLDAPVASHLVVHPLGGKEADFWERLRYFEMVKVPIVAERYWPPLVPYSETLATLQREGIERVRGEA